MKLTPTVWVNIATLYDNEHKLMFKCTTLGNQPATLDNLCCKLEYIHEARRITTQREDQVMDGQVTELKNRDSEITLEYADLSDAPRELIYIDKENDLWRFNAHEDRWEFRTLPFCNCGKDHPLASGWSRLAPGVRVSQMRNIGPFKRYEPRNK